MDAFFKFLTDCSRREDWITIIVVCGKIGSVLCSMFNCLARILSPLYVLHREITVEENADAHQDNY
jgi:hypothetical protein